MNIQEICAKFDVKGNYRACKELSTGNINNTFLLIYDREDGEHFYILQRINKSVFTNPEGVMDNIVKVTSYIHDNVKEAGLSTRKYVLYVFKTLDGKDYFIDDENEYWRLYRYIPNSVTFDSTNDLEIIEKVGLAFGYFQKRLDGFDAESLFITIPDFHNTIKRFEDFKRAIKNDAFNRLSGCKKEVEELLALEEKATELQRLLERNEIPLRVTHNDTKANNVCFDKDTKEALAVLDLDTVMPGAVAFDFGDAVRFIASNTEEDDPNLSAVRIDFDKYRAFTKGFVSVSTHLTKKEKETLNLGVLAMTVELAIRFLGDYINGDTYFKVKYPGHNFDRARNQLTLSKDIVKNYDKLQSILFEYLA